VNTIQGKGSARGIPGNVDQAPGTPGGDLRIKPRGQVQQASGELEAKLAERLDEVRVWTVERPITALVITASIAFVLGARWASNWHRNNA